MYGRKHTEEEKQNLSKKMSGANNHRYGKHYSEETRKKISEKNKGRIPTAEMRRKQAEAQKGILKGRPRPQGSGRPNRKVLCVETGVVFDSVADAARKNGIASKTNISACAKGKQKTASGYHWQYITPFIS